MTFSQDYLTPSNSSTCSSVAGPDEVFPELYKSQRNLISSPKYRLLSKGLSKEARSMCGTCSCSRSRPVAQLDASHGSQTSRECSKSSIYFLLKSPLCPSFSSAFSQEYYPQEAQKSCKITVSSDLKQPHQASTSAHRHFDG